MVAFRGKPGLVRFLADATVGKLSSSPRAAYWGKFLVTTDWDAYRSEAMLNSVMRAVGPTSLLSWLSGPADGYMTDEIVDRFAYEGDDKSGDWLPLTESTRRIREDLGFPGSNPINERTGGLLDFVMHSRDYISGSNWAGMEIPGDPGQVDLERKLLHAQRGATENPRFPGAITPPRPVLAVDESDMESLLKILEMHIMESVAAGI